MEPPSYRTLQKGKVNVLVPPRIMEMMTGVIRVTQDVSGDMTAHYCDGTTEKAHWPEDAPELLSTGDFFKVVSTVQSQARRVELKPLAPNLADDKSVMTIKRKIGRWDA